MRIVFASVAEATCGWREDEEGVGDEVCEDDFIVINAFGSCAEARTFTARVSLEADATPEDVRCCRIGAPRRGCRVNAVLLPGTATVFCPHPAARGRLAEEGKRQYLLDTIEKEKKESEPDHLALRLSLWKSRHSWP